MAASYHPGALERGGSAGPIPHLHDPQLRTNLILAAAGGMSRNGSADFCGVPRSSLKSWLARGLAEPRMEPYGSFARDYFKASRVLEAAGSAVLARRLAWLRKQPSDAIESRDVKFVLDALAARYPAEWGVSKHREPEAEVTAEQWLEQNGMTHEQLVALFADPPEAIGRALLAAGDTVVARLLATGWAPSESLCDVVDARRAAKEPG
jgi:hypothetical protein